MVVITCGVKSLEVKYHSNVGSEHIKDSVKLFNNVNVNIPIPDVYFAVIDTYVEYCKGVDIPINDKTDLFLSFQLSIYMVDDDYFKYCVQQTFNQWIDMCNMVYNEFSDDIRRSFFLHSPYEFIPKHLLDDNTFMTQYNKLNQNTFVNVNDSITYHSIFEHLHYNGEDNDYDTRKIIKRYHCNDEQEIKHEKVIKYHPNSTIVHIEENYVDDIMSGVRRVWYNSTNRHLLEHESYFVNGINYGSDRSWYDDDLHTLKYEGYWNSKGLHGLYRLWYPDIQHQHHHHTLRIECHYDNGKLNGKLRAWYDNDKHTLKCEGQYVNDKKDGHWFEFDPDGNITFDGEYVNGVKQ